LSVTTADTASIVGLARAGHTIATGEGTGTVWGGLVEVVVAVPLWESCPSEVATASSGGGPASGLASVVQETVSVGLWEEVVASQELEVLQASLSRAVPFASSDPLVVQSLSLGISVGSGLVVPGGVVDGSVAEVRAGERASRQGVASASQNRGSVGSRTVDLDLVDQRAWVRHGISELESALALVGIATEVTLELVAVISAVVGPDSDFELSRRHCHLEADSLDGRGGDRVVAGSVGHGCRDWGAGQSREGLLSNGQLEAVGVGIRRHDSEAVQPANNERASWDLSSAPVSVSKFWADIQSAEGDSRVPRAALSAVTESATSRVLESQSGGSGIVVGCSEVDSNEVASSWGEGVESIVVGGGRSGSSHGHTAGEGHLWDGGGQAGGHCVFVDACWSARSQRLHNNIVGSRNGVTDSKGDCGRGGSRGVCSVDAGAESSHVVLGNGNSGSLAGPILVEGDDQLLTRSWVDGYGVNGLLSSDEGAVGWNVQSQTNGGWGHHVESEAVVSKCNNGEVQGTGLHFAELIACD